jgi:hypothetical protein
MEYVHTNDLGEEIIRKLEDQIRKINKQFNKGGNSNEPKFSDTLIPR